MLLSVIGLSGVWHGLHNVLSIYTAVSHTTKLFRLSLHTIETELLTTLLLNLSSVNIYTLTYHVIFNIKFQFIIIFISVNYPNPRT